MFRILVAVAVLGFVLPCGCASTSESAAPQSLTADVGNYPSPPPGAPRMRVGVPAFTFSGYGTDATLASVAGDQLTTLVVRANRFDVIERAQLDQVLAEQNLGGVVRADQLAEQGKVGGAQYLMIGKVTNFRVKRANTRRGFGLGRVRLPYAGSVGLADFQKSDSSITTEVGVDLRLVDSTTGSIVAADTEDFTRTDKVSAFGLEIIGVGASADADVQISDDSKGLVLRLALDKCLRDMLPNIDAKLSSLAAEKAAATTSPPDATDGGND